MLAVTSLTALSKNAPLLTCGGRSANGVMPNLLTNGGKILHSDVQRESSSYINIEIRRDLLNLAN